MPCIMVGLGELKNIIRQFPEVIDNIRRIEGKVKRSFFPPNFIPQRFMTGRDKNNIPFPWVDDVVKYVSDDPDQIQMFEEEAASCMSYYSLCE